VRHRHPLLCLGLTVDHHPRAVDNSCRVTCQGEAAMTDRSGLVASAAYAAMTRSGRRVLHLIEGEVERGGGTASISLYDFDRRFGCSRRATCFALKQLALLGFVVAIGTGARRVNTFTLIDGWRAVHAVEAKRLVELARLPKPQRAALPKLPKPVKPPKASKPPKVKRPRMNERRVVSLPRLSFMDDGR
jgi:hypothetical protein